MTSFAKYISLLVALVIASSAGATVTVSTSHPDSVRMGSRAVLKVDITRSATDNGSAINLPPLVIPTDSVADYHGIEIYKAVADSAMGNGGKRVSYIYYMQPFNPGEFHLPTPGFVTAAGDTIYSSPVTLKVTEVDVNAHDPNDPKALIPLNPDEGTRSIEARWYDIFPEWWPWALGALLLIGAGVAAFLYIRRRRRLIAAGILKPKKPIPPYTLAMKRLKRLRNQRLAENGEEKEFYTRLTDILRQYLEGRFGINAMEMTSRQIVEALEASAETASAGEPLKEILEIADFVKFAKVRPESDDNIKSFNTIYTFVESTKPLPDQQKPNAGRQEPPTQNK